MVRFQEQEVTYRHPFSAVTASLWSKYDNHKHVKQVDVIDRYIGEDGRLYSTRLLTMEGNLPAMFRPFCPVRCIHMLEHVVVDAEAQTMEVRAHNINMASVLEAVSASDYKPSKGGESTDYRIGITVRAFPNRKRRASSGQAGADAVERTGYVAGKLENWVAKKLIGNVGRGRQYIDAFCRQQVAMCEGGEAPSGPGGAAGGGAPLAERARGSTLLSLLLGGRQ